MCNLGFSPEICNWTVFFLKDRSVQLWFNNYVLDTIDLELGTSQGSPISLILSIIYMSLLLYLAKLWTDASFLIYVNDINIFARAPTYELLAHKLQDCYLACHSWCWMVGLTIKPEKLEILFFSYRRPFPTVFYKDL